MEVTFHSLVAADILEILKYYHDISPNLADDFAAELRGTIDRITENPLRFRLLTRGFRRANLRRFPYHVLFEARPPSVRVMLVRHHRRNPQYGLDRR